MTRFTSRIKTNIKIVEKEKKQKTSCINLVNAKWSYLKMSTISSSVRKSVLWLRLIIKECHLSYLKVLAAV